MQTEVGDPQPSDTCLEYPNQGNPFVVPSLTTPWMCGQTAVQATMNLLSMDSQSSLSADLEEDEKQPWAVMFRMDLMCY